MLIFLVHWMGGYEMIWKWVFSVLFLVSWIPLLDCFWLFGFLELIDDGWVSMGGGAVTCEKTKKYLHVLKYVPIVSRLIDE